MAQQEKPSTSSRYLPMRDGVKIAIDIHLPPLDDGGKIPTILRQTRYLRNIEFRKPFSYFLKTWFLDTQATARKLFLRKGYAWIDVDVRGSGASFGVWTSPWSQDMVKDGSEILDWIVNQPWSNGKVGSLGISYDGTHADFIATTGHPALKAISPRFSSFDVYGDVAAPGGIILDHFLSSWQCANDAFDTNQPELFVKWFVTEYISEKLNKTIGELLGSIAGILMKIVFRGVRPVDEDEQRVMLKSAIQNRSRNFNVYQQSRHMTYREDPSHSENSVGITVESFSPHNFVKEIGIIWLQTMD